MQIQNHKLTTTIVIDYFTLENVKELSKKLDISRSAFIRQAIAEKLEKGHVQKTDATV